MDTIIARAEYKSNPSHLLKRSCPTVESMVNFIKKFKDHKAVVGLSGGIDSAVVAALAVNAVGKKNVYAVMMPSATSESEDLEYAVKQAELLDINYETFPINKIVAAAERTNPKYFKSRVQKGNLHAESRMLVLYDKAWQVGGLVYGTSNMSEYMTGYFTKFGDGAADIEPIINLYKTQVRQVAKELDVIAEIRCRKPTAGLWPGQTDEGELGVDYETLDKILLGNELKFDTKEISKINSLPHSFVNKILSRVETNVHKRTPAYAPEPKFKKEFSYEYWR